MWDVKVLLVGLFGSDKSTIAKILREDFGRNVIELNKIVEVEKNKGVYELLYHNGPGELEKVECSIINRFRKFDDFILVTNGFCKKIPDDFVVIYVKTTKEAFKNRVRKYLNPKVVDEIYEKIHKFFSHNSQLVISEENKIKFEIANIIDAFVRHKK